ncbi:MAG: hypothetical protein M1836_002666 [Candelina mexicana]|nr:MAG: hypothetical protein M1836_002666 [Candelina mexicana]
MSLCSNHLLFATRKLLRTTPPTLPSLNDTPLSVPLPPRPSSRRGDINRQLYQFALGFPQTPPDEGNEIDPIGPLLKSAIPGKSEKMGSFVFKWHHPASEVYVTGTFDDWAKSVKLDKTGSGYEKKVELSEVDEKIYYKFVVDGNWTTDHTAPQEDDGHNNINNFLLPNNITKTHPSKPEPPPEAGTMSNVTPLSTTAGLAGQVQKESRSKEPTSAAISSASPESTTAGLAGNVPKEPYSREPTSATISSAAPDSTTAMLAGNVPKEGDSKQSASEIISSAAPDSTTTELAKHAPVEDRPTSSSSAMPGVFPETPITEPSEFSVNPIPATAGAGNPIDLAPGEKVPDPSTLTSNTTKSTAHDDKSLVRSNEDAQQTFGVAPLPATEGIGNPIHLKPGERVPKPEEFTSNTIHSSVRTDKESYENSGTALSGAPQQPSEDTQQTFGVAPLPATSGPGNPISLKPGEKVPEPSSFTANTIGSGVTTDRESYEKGSAISGAPQLPNVVTPQKERDQRGGGIFGLPPVSSNMIPESSLPMGVGTPSEPEPGVTIQSAGPQSTTADLAGKVPLEPRAHSKGVPEVVRESQERAHVDPEASGSPEVVMEKIAMEQELKREVGPEPVTSESTYLGPRGETEPALATSGVPTIVQDSQHRAHVGPEASSSPVAVQDKRAVENELKDRVAPEPTTSEGAVVAGGSSSKPFGAAADVPEVVQASQQRAHVEPEASSSPVAVQEKKAMEDELQSKIPQEPTVAEGTSREGGGTTDKEENPLGGGEIASVTAGSGVVGGITAAGSSGFDQSSAYGHSSDLGSGYLPASIQQSINEINSSYKGSGTSSAVPDVVQESLSTSHRSPEAASNPDAVADKNATERELLNELKPAPASSESTPTTGEKSAIGASSRVPAGVPGVVQESINQAHKSPEAAASNEAVAEKQAMEDELLRKIPSEQGAGEPAPAISSALATSAPAPTTSTPASTAPIDTNMPSSAVQSTTREEPLTSATITSPSADGLAAPASVPAMTPSTKQAEQQKAATGSRDVSPMSKGAGTDGQAQPTVTTGVGESKVESVSKPAPISKSAAQDVSTPASKSTATPKSTSTGAGAGSTSAVPARQSSPGSARTSESTASDKKSKRRSFFGKLKDKLK